MHVHQSLWKGGEPLFYDETGYAGLSDIGRWYIGGLLSHAPAILAFAAPTTNSYKRLVPGYEAPVNLVYSQRNRSASCRIPLYSQEPQGQAGRVPLPGPVVQPVPGLLGHADGRPRRHPEPDRAARRRSTRTSTTCRPRSWPWCPQVPGSLDESLAALEADHDFLKAGGVFTDDLIETWIAYKREQRDRRGPPAAAPVRVRPLLRHLDTGSPDPRFCGSGPTCRPSGLRRSGGRRRRDPRSRRDRREDRRGQPGTRMVPVTGPVVMGTVLV